MIAIRRCFEIIEFVKQEGPVRFVDIAREFSFSSNSTLSRLLKTLTDIGVIQKVKGKYQIGLVSATNSLNPFLMEPFTEKQKGKIQNIMDSLSMEWGFSFGLFTQLGKMTMRMSLSSPIQDEPTLWPIGFENPLQPMNAYSKIFLAWKDEEIRRNSYFIYGKRHCPEQLQPWEDFLSELKRIKTTRVSLELGEFRKNLYAVAIPVFLNKASNKEPEISFGFSCYSDHDFENLESIVDDLKTKGTMIKDLLL